MVDHGSDVTVLKNPNFAVSSLDREVHHGTSQVVGPDNQIWKRQLEGRVDRAQQPIAEIRFLPRLDRIDIRRPKEVDAWKAGREKCVFGLSLVSCKSDATSSRSVRAVSAQEREGGVRAAAMQNARELDRVVYSYPAKFSLRNRARIDTQTKDSCVLT